MLARAFTTRRKKVEAQISTSSFLGRAASLRGRKPVSRSQISAPVALLSTSNVLLNNAQVIAGATPIDYVTASSASSISSGSAEDSGASTSNASIHSTETATDASSIGESPMSSEPKPNHLSCYFHPAVDTQSTASSHSPSSRHSFDTPTIPQRSPSHSKKAHEGLHRKNSVKRMLAPVSRGSVETFSTAPSGSFVEAPTEEHPFDRELAQLDEVAEEFGQVIQDAETAADAAVMQSYGLAHFAASDYLSEIQTLIYDTFEVAPGQPMVRWI